MNRAEEYRKKRSQAAEPTAEITVPSGAVFLCRRPPLEVWIAAGRVPQGFLMKMQRAERGETSVETLSNEETIATITFVRQALLYAVVEPRLVPGATGESELDPADLDVDDFHFLTQWVLSGCPGVPVKTKGGEVSADNLAQFRQKRPGGAPLPRVDSETVREAPESIAGLG